jgi:hypothetical protein
LIPLSVSRQDQEVKIPRISGIQPLYEGSLARELGEGAHLFFVRSQQHELRSQLRTFLQSPTEFLA